MTSVFMSSSDLERRLWKLPLKAGDEHVAIGLKNGKWDWPLQEGGGGTFPSLVLNRISGLISSIGSLYIVDM